MHADTKIEPNANTSTVRLPVMPWLHDWYFPSGDLGELKLYDALPTCVEDAFS